MAILVCVGSTALFNNEILVASSTLEAKYAATWFAKRKKLWIQRMLSEMLDEDQKSLNIFGDNQAMIDASSDELLKKKETY